MCGRYTLSKSPEEIASAFQVACLPDLQPHFNIAPSQLVAVVLQTTDQPGRQLKLLRWGLIPSWAKDPAIGNKLINARSETVSEKPSFRSAFKHRRCLVIADGFYEWQRLEGDKRNKLPYYFCLSVRQPIAFAGLWERWQSSEGEVIETCTILTTEANELLQPIHDRMPVILQPEDYDRWLDPNFKQIGVLQSLLKPYPSEAMVSYRVSNKVNAPKNDSPDCQLPLAEKGFEQ